MKKLYELARGSLFYCGMPNMADVEEVQIYKLHNLDGMYSYCTNVKTGDVLHFAAYADVWEYDEVSNG